MLRFHHYSLGKREKKMRITAALQPLFSHGRIIFDPGIAEIGKLEQALLEHPRTSNDNGPDALSLLDDPAVSAPAKPPKEEEKAANVTPVGIAEGQEIELAFRREMARRAFESVRKKKGELG